MKRGFVFPGNDVQPAVEMAPEVEGAGSREGRPPPSLPRRGGAGGRGADTGPGPASSVGQEPEAEAEFGAGLRLSPLFADRQLLVRSV